MTKENQILYTKCAQYAMSYIDRFPKSEKDLVSKLYTKGYNSQEINQTVDFLKEKNFLNDRMFAESYIRSEIINKGKPFMEILQKLWKKGIDKNIVNEAFEEHREDAEKGMVEGIKKHIKKYKQKGVEGFDIIQKLMQKGYKLDYIKQAIEERNQLDK